jgi:hypothetical protein|tara:strand:+ start:1384 stop:1911 length:528 start_codon:yes stop_codon:yes gene_type:complete
MSGNASLSSIRRTHDYQQDKHQTIHDDFREACGGYFRVRDWEKYQKWGEEVGREEHPGNCFEANYDLFLKLKAEGHKTIWFVSALLHNGSVGGINHAFLLDGDIVIDHSQFQEKSLCAHRYFTANKVVKYDVWDKCPPSPEALRARAGLGQYSHSGSIRLGPSTRQLAMRKIINL